MAARKHGVEAGGGAPEASGAAGVPGAAESSQAAGAAGVAKASGAAGGLGASRGPPCSDADAVEHTVGELLGAARARLAAASDSARLDAELLLAHATGLARSTLVAFPERGVAARVAASFDALVARRELGLPIAYLTGHQAFHGVELSVTPDVLVPRPETELIVDEILERFGPECPVRVLDLGAGSGAIALAVKHARPAFVVTGVDSSRAALDVAIANARRLGLDVEWRASSWYEALGAARYDVIACNPPYVASDDPHFEGPLRHEPRAALDGGPDGLDAVRLVLDGAAARLASGGLLLVEHGWDQRGAVHELAATRGFAVLADRDDLAGRPRLVVLRGRAP